MVGIQIHSVDNNAAVPWEWHEYDNRALSDAKIGAGTVLWYAEKGLTSGNQALPGNRMYLSVFRQVVPANSVDNVVLAPIRDDMVLEGYVRASGEMPVMLGEKAALTGQQDNEGFSVMYFATERLTGITGGRFEIVGIITDCEPVEVEMGQATATLTQKVLVRLVK